MIPTPDLSHLTKEDYGRVYEPAEDTFLLLDALEKDAQSMKMQNPAICLEIGSGSGCVTSFLGKILGPCVLYLCTDINAYACRCTQSTGRQNGIDIHVVNGSLATPFELRLAQKVDVLVFNPPYVPTSEEEVYGSQAARHIGASWAGGVDGMQITDIMLKSVEMLLSPNGRFYLVALRQNNIPRIVKSMKEAYGLHGEIVLERRAGREHLFIVRFMHKVPY